MLNLSEIKVAIYDLDEPDRVEVLDKLFAEYGPQEVAPPTEEEKAAHAKAEEAAALADKEAKRLADEQEKARVAAVEKKKEEILASVAGLEEDSRNAILQAIARDFGRGVEKSVKTEQDTPPSDDGKTEPVEVSTRMSRAELDAIATDLGLTPDVYPNIGELVDAIHKAQRKAARK